jgi:hypothetical protein
MSDRDQPDDEPLIKNPATRQRRAWIDHAIAAVREKLQDGSLPASPGRPPAGMVRGARYRPRLTVIQGGRTDDE